MLVFHCFLSFDFWVCLVRVGRRQSSDQLFCWPSTADILTRRHAMSDRLPSFNHGDLGRGMHEQFCVFPFIFNSFYQVGTAVCHTWEISGSWALLQAWQISPHTAPLRFPKPPQSLSAHHSQWYLTYILDLYCGYLGPILTISWHYILGLSHFLNTFNTLSLLVHHTCTTFWLNLLNSIVK